VLVLDSVILQTQIPQQSGKSAKKARMPRKSAQVINEFSLHADFVF